MVRVDFKVEKMVLSDVFAGLFVVVGVWVVVGVEVGFVLVVGVGVVVRVGVGEAFESVMEISEQP